MKNKTTYQAWICSQFSNYLDLELVELPFVEPVGSEVLVRTMAFAPGFPDMLMVDGKYQLRPDLPFTPCMEFSGEIIGVGSKVERLAIGESVMGTVRFGSGAQQVITNEAECFSIPDGFDFIDAAGFLVAYKTAYVALISRGHLCRNEVVLIHGASGGVGLAAVQLAKHIGAKVIVVVSSQVKADALAKYEPDHILVCSDNFFENDINTITQNHGADVIFDPVGGDVFDESTKCIAPFGRILVVGFAGGRIAKIETNHVLIKQYSVIGVRAGEYGRLDRTAGDEVMKNLLGLASSGVFQPHIHDVLGFQDLIKAFDCIASRKVVGRIIIDALR